MSRQKGFAHILLLFLIIFIGMAGFFVVLKKYPKITKKQKPVNVSVLKVGQGVIEALQAEGGVNVVVLLVEPPSMSTSSIDLPSLKRDIASLQDDVLSSLDSSEFRVKLRYQAVPALAGRVLSEAGLTKLAANPNVVRIDLDVGGTGSQSVLEGTPCKTDGDCINLDCSNYPARAPADKEEGFCIFNGNKICSQNKCICQLVCT